MCFLRKTIKGVILGRGTRYRAAMHLDILLQVFYMDPMLWLLASVDSFE